MSYYYRKHIGTKCSVLKPYTDKIFIFVTICDTKQNFSNLMVTEIIKGYQNFQPFVNLEVKKLKYNVTNYFHSEIHVINSITDKSSTNTIEEPFLRDGSDQ